MHVRLRITHGQEQVAGGPELHPMEALMKVAQGLAPQQFLRFQVVPTGDGVSHAVKRRVGQHKEVIAIDLEVVQPGVLGEAVQFPTRAEAAFRRWFINVQRFATTDEQTP